MSDVEQVADNGVRPKGKFHPYTLDELSKLPPPEWLITGLLPANAHVFMAGESESYKTFVTLDIALHVASGAAWQGREVKKVPVVYVAAEGGPGLLKRINAWKNKYPNRAVDANIRVITEPVSLRTKSEVALFLEQLDAVGFSKPGLIVFDTFARCFDGEENSSKETGEAIAALENIRKQTGATTLYLHHTLKSQKSKGKKVAYRGSSALGGAADTILTTLRTGDDVELAVHKQKDAEKAKPIVLRLRECEWLDKDGNLLASLVVESGYQQAADKSELSGKEQGVLLALAMAGGKATTEDWQNAAGTHGEPMPYETLNRHRKTLEEKGFVQRVAGYDKGYYELTAKGSAATANKVLFAARGKMPIFTSAATATPPKGVAWQLKGWRLWPAIEFVLDPATYADMGDDEEDEDISFEEERVN